MFLPGVVAAQICKLTETEQQVYRAIFKQTQQTAVISAIPERIPLARFNALANHHLPEWGRPPEGSVAVSGSSFQEMKRDYDRKAAQRCLIPPLGGTSIVVVKEQELRHLRQRASEESDLRKRIGRYDELFRKRYGANAQGYRVSRVAFDIAGRLAVVHVSSDAGGLFYVLRLVGSHWQINGMYQTWAT
jgi:hypothetical protein